MSAAKNSWPRVRLGDVCEVLDSRRKPIAKVNRVPGTIPYYGATGVVDYIDDWLFDERLVLLGEDGAKWGAGDPSAFIAEGRFWVNNHAHVLKPCQRLLDCYLVYYLNCTDLSDAISGVTVPKLNQQRMRDISFPLPPLPVQREIVARLERELGAVDELAKKFEELAQAAEAEFKATLKETFEKISHGGTETRRLGEVCEKIGSGATPLGGKKTYREDGVALIRSQNVLDLEFSPKGLAHISDEQAERLKSVSVCEGDVLLNITGDSVARACVVDPKSLPSRVNQHVAIIRIRDKQLVCPRYLELALVAIKKDLLEEAQKGATRKALTKDYISSIELPLPPLPTQREIVARLDAAKARKDALVAAAKRGRETAVVWRKAILKEAFE